MKRFVGFVVMGMLASLFYVSQEVEAVKIGYTIRKQEETKTLYLDRSRALQYNIARLKAPNTLEKRLEAKKISLQAPKSWQTLVLSQPRPATDSAARSFLAQPPVLTKFLVGTAQAEAKES